MDKVDLPFPQEDPMLATSTGTKWMDGVSSSILPVGLPMKGTGNLVNLTATVNCSIRHLCMWKPLTIATLTRFKRKMMVIGRYMRGG